MAALPGVEAAALADGRPPSEAGQHNNFDLEDHPTTAGQNQPVCTWVGVSPGFFKAVGPAPRARPAARRAVAAGRRRRRRPRLGGSVLPGPGSPRPPVQERRMHVLRLDDGRRRRQFGEVGWAGVERSGHGLFPFRRSAERLLRAPHDRRPGVGRDGPAPGRPGTGSRAGRDERRDRRRRSSRDSLSAPRYLSVLVGDVRDRRAGAVGRRHLRRDGALRPAAHARHRHPAGARRRTVARAADGRRAGAAPRGPGVGVGVGALLTARLLTTVLFGVRPTDLRDDGGRAARARHAAAIACLVPAAAPPGSIRRRSCARAEERRTDFRL